MAKLEQGILGPFRGKVGTVVGYLWRGRHVVRAYRKEINYPNTEKQQAERQWFVEMVRFAATARQALLLGLREKASQWQMTECNAFVKLNKDCFDRDAERGIPTDYEHIIVSEGPAAPVRFTSASIDANGVLRVEYEKNSAMSRAKASDGVYIYIYNTAKREGLLSHPAERRRGHMELLLPDGWNALNTRLWGFTVDTEGRASTSAFIAWADGDGNDGSAGGPKNVGGRSLYLEEEAFKVLALRVMDGDGVVDGVGQLADDADAAAGIHGGGEDHGLEVVAADGLAAAEGHQ